MPIPTFADMVIAFPARRWRVRTTSSTVLYRARACVFLNAGKAGCAARALVGVNGSASIFLRLLPAAL
jgi:hypothetical protein